jgi:hypothetical protein
MVCDNRKRSSDSEDDMDFLAKRIKVTNIDTKTLKRSREDPLLDELLKPFEKKLRLTDIPTTSKLPASNYSLPFIQEEEDVEETENEHYKPVLNLLLKNTIFNKLLQTQRADNSLVLYDKSQQGRLSFLNFLESKVKELKDNEMDVMCIDDAC